MSAHRVGADVVSTDRAGADPTATSADTDTADVPTAPTPAAEPETGIIDPVAEDIARPGRRAEPAGDPLLELRDLTRSVRLPSRERLDILTGIDLTVRGGDHIAIVGRSGSGKSTLLNLLGLIDRQTGGELLFDGRPVARLSDRRRAHLRGSSIGFVFQQFNLLDGRTALENVMMPLLYGSAGQFWRRERIAREMLDRVGLGDRAHQKPNRLSGGEQQRVAVARALVRRPRLILADEPTGALDVTTGEAVMSLLDEISRESGSALVTITHDLQVAALSRRSYLLDGGRLHDVGTEHARTALAATGGIRASRAAVAEATDGAAEEVGTDGDAR